MKYREAILEQLKSLPHFNKQAISQLSRPFGIKSATVDEYVKRSLTRRDIIPLKKGMYVTTDFYEKNAGDMAYKFYLANVIKTPSYVSSWTALQYYDLTTEIIAGVTSVTPKITRTYRTKAGNFMYQSIKRELYSGFSLMKGKFNFFIAPPSKALFDLMYFRTRQFRGIRLDAIEEMVEDLRIDWDEMERKERAAFLRLTKNYLAGHE